MVTSGTLIFSTKKSDSYDVTEILLRVHKTPTTLLIEQTCNWSSLFFYLINLNERLLFISEMKMICWKKKNIYTGISMHMFNFVRAQPFSYLECVISSSDIDFFCLRVRWCYKIFFQKRLQHPPPPLPQIRIWLVPYNSNMFLSIACLGGDAWITNLCKAILTHIYFTYHKKNTHFSTHL